MAFLRLNKSGDVIVSDEGMQLPCVQNLFRKDKTKTKSYFEKSKIYVYHVFTKKHDLNFLSFSSRTERVQELYLPNYDISKIVTDPLVQEIVKEYKFQQFTTNELAYEALKEDFVKLKKFISNIPYEIEKDITETIVVEFPYDGKIIEQRIPIKTTIKVDNSEARYKAMAQLKQLLILEKDIRNLIEEEEIDKKKRKIESMMDQGMFV